MTESSSRPEPHSEHPSRAEALRVALPLMEGDRERLAPVVEDWGVRATRIDAWVRENVPFETPGITTFDHHRHASAAGYAR